MVCSPLICLVHGWVGEDGMICKTAKQSDAIPETASYEIRHMWHTEDNRYSFRVAFIELRVRRSTAAHGWLAVSPSPRPSWRPTTPVIAAGRDRCFQCILYTTTTPAVPDFTCHLCARTDRPRRAVLFGIRGQTCSTHMDSEIVAHQETFTATSTSTANHLRSMLPCL